MGLAWIRLAPAFCGFTEVIECDRGAPCPRTQGGPVEDLAYIGLTILVFAVLWLLVKGVERFER
jgi:hypothetical protein